MSAESDDISKLLADLVAERDLPPAPVPPPPTDLEVFEEYFRARVADRPHEGIRLSR